MPPRRIGISFTRLITDDTARVQEIATVGARWRRRRLGFLSRGHRALHDWEMVHV
jgi:hypothetical protein